MAHLNGAHVLEPKIDLTLDVKQAAEVLRALQIVGRVAAYVGLSSEIPRIIATAESITQRMAFAGFEAAVNDDGHVTVTKVLEKRGGIVTEDLS